MIENDKERNEFCVKGQLTVNKKFNWKKIAEFYQNIYSFINDNQG